VSRSDDSSVATATRSARTGAVRAAWRERPRLTIVPERPLRIADVALWYGERSGGIKSYLDAKVAYHATQGGFEHHLITPGPVERHEDGHHELRAVRIGAANGYRMPLGAHALRRTLREIRPDVVLLHDPFWAPLRVAEAAHEAGAVVVAVHHGSGELAAAGLPGPSRLYVPAIRAWLRRASMPVDAIMSVVDTRADCGRAADIPLRLGLHEAFRPQPGARRGDHTLYVGRLAREKGVFELLEAAARSQDRWPLRFVGAGPAQDRLAERARRLGLRQRVSFHPFVADRDRLARLYAEARCVVMPGAHETFGLVALEAAASGARAVCCTTAPSGLRCGDLAERYLPGDIDGLARAIETARAAVPDPAGAAALAWRHAWPRVFHAELASLRQLIGDR